MEHEALHDNIDTEFDRDSSLARIARYITFDALMKRADDGALTRDQVFERMRGMDQPATGGEL